MDISKPLTQHLEELRLCIIKCFISILVFCIFSYIWIDEILNILIKPIGHLVFIKPTEALMSQIKIVFTIGCIIAFPFILFQIWKFISIGLSKKEKSVFAWLLPLSYSLLIVGILMGFFIFTPIGIKFLLKYETNVLQSNITINHYIDFVNFICCSSGMLLQIPIISFCIGYLQLIHWSFFIKKRRIFLLVSYIVSAFLTPGTDPIMALLLLLPVYIVYELSVFVLTWGWRKREKNIIIDD